MGKRSPQTAMKRAREQALREKRELKQAKKDARAAARLAGPDPPAGPDDHATVEIPE
jgi:hypothetical protein